MQRTREQEHEMLYRLEELKEEYATLHGWTEQEYWSDDDEKLYAAECYAYDILAREYGGE